MPSVQSKETDKESEKKLQCLYRHIALNLVVLTAPFTQRADLFLTFPEFGMFVFIFAFRLKFYSQRSHSGGSISKVSAAMATLSSFAALFEFCINPLSGKLSDAHGRKMYVVCFTHR